MTAPTKERINEILSMRSTDSRQGDMEALGAYIEALQKQIDYVRGIMQGQELECRERESQEKVYHVQVETLRAELDRLKETPVVVPSLTDKELDELYPSPDYTRQERGSFVEGYNLAASRAHDIGPGKVLVNRTLLEKSLHALRCSAPYIGCGFDHTDLWHSAINNLDAVLGAQAKQDPQTKNGAQ